MRTITKTVYLYDELPAEKAKHNALAWYQETSSGDEWWESTYEDAARIGLKITEFDTGGRASGITGIFTHDVYHIADLIRKEHGETCDTHKLATEFQRERDNLVETWERDEDGELVRECALDNKLDALEAEFFRAVKEEYLSMLRREYDYTQSREYAEENIRANEYTFDESGKREG